MNPVNISPATIASARETGRAFSSKNDECAVKKINATLISLAKMCDLPLSLEQFQSIWPHFAKVRTLLAEVENPASKSAGLANCIETQTKCLFQIPAAILRPNEISALELDVTMNEFKQCLALVREDIAQLASSELRKPLGDAASSTINGYRKKCRHVELQCQLGQLSIESSRADDFLLPDGLDSSREITEIFSEAAHLTQEMYERIFTPDKSGSSTMFSWVTTSIANLYAGIIATDEHKMMTDTMGVYVQRNTKAVDARFNLAMVVKSIVDEDLGLIDTSKQIYLTQKQRCFSSLGLLQAPLVGMYMVHATFCLMTECVEKIKFSDVDKANKIQNICRLNWDLNRNLKELIDIAGSVFRSHLPAHERIRIGLNEPVITDQKAIGRFVHLGNRCEACARRYDAFANELKNWHFVTDEIKSGFGSIATELRRMRLTILSELERRGYIAPDLPQKPAAQSAQGRQVQQRLINNKANKKKSPKTAEIITKKNSLQALDIPAAIKPIDGQIDHSNIDPDDLLSPEYFGVELKTYTLENKKLFLKAETLDFQEKLNSVKERLVRLQNDPDDWRTQTIEQITAVVDEQNNALDMHALYTDFTINRLKAICKFPIEDEEKAHLQHQIQTLHDEHNQLVGEISKPQFPNPRTIRNMAKARQIGTLKMTKERLQYFDPKTQETNLFDVIQVCRKEGNGEVPWFEVHAHYHDEDGKKSYIKNAMHLKHLSQAGKGRLHEEETGEQIKRLRLSEKDFRELFIQ